MVCRQGRGSGRRRTAGEQRGRCFIQVAAARETERLLAFQDGLARSRAEELAAHFRGRYLQPVSLQLLLQPRHFLADRADTKLLSHRGFLSE